jgi:hypothetical protein
MKNDEERRSWLYLLKLRNGGPPLPPPKSNHQSNQTKRLPTLAVALDSQHNTKNVGPESGKHRPGKLFMCSAILVYYELMGKVTHTFFLPPTSPFLQFDAVHQRYA